MQPHAFSRCAPCPAFAAIVTIDFDEIEGLYPDSYTESGFVFVSLSPQGGHLHAGTGSLWLHSREGSSPYQIRREDGASFDFLSFDYLGGDSLFVADTGATFTILGEVPLTHYVMPAGFQNVSHVNWYMTTEIPDDPFGEQWGNIDNIAMAVIPVPEPAQATLFGFGLAALIAAARRRSRR